jgi:hypothetical protein
VKVAFLYPCRSHEDALLNWVQTLARHCKRHEVRHAHDGQCRAWADVILLLTQGQEHHRELCDRHIRDAREYDKPVGVVHNWEAPGVPTPGPYPSFCWTAQAKRNLARYDPVLLRQPVLPSREVGPVKGTLLGTFGILEPKKNIHGMHAWAKSHGVPFRAYGIVPPEYEGYRVWLREGGCEVIPYRRRDTVEELADLFAAVSHWLFDLLPGKAGTGGSPTSPRYAAHFGRPVIVVDDEDTFRADGYHVYGSLGGLRPEHLGEMGPPRSDWTPDAYVDRLLWHTLQFWRGR